jgi:hypothetical protein
LQQKGLVKLQEQAAQEGEVETVLNLQAGVVQPAKELSAPMEEYIQWEA